MASITFTDYSTVVPAAWLNDVNSVTYTGVFPNAVNLSNVANITTTGNTVLGDATTDTFNQGAGSLAKTAAGNWTIAAPSSGTALIINAVSGDYGININGAAGSFSAMRLLENSSNKWLLTSGTEGAGIFSIYNLVVGNSAVKILPAGNVTIAAPSSGVGLTVSSGIKLTPIAVAALPAAATAGAGTKYFVTDANATTFASIVAGGGANGVPVYSDGTNWRIG